MSLFKIKSIWCYNFKLNGRRYSKSSGMTRKSDALMEEAKVRSLILGGQQEVVQREQRERERQTITVAADAFLEEYRAKHRAPGFAEYILGRVKRLLGSTLIMQITPAVMKRYQTDRLNEGGAPKTINEEVGMLLRLCGAQGDSIRGQLRREKSLKLQVPESPGKPFEADEQARMLAAARSSTMAARESCLRQTRGETAPHGEQQGSSPAIYPSLVLALNCGMRDGETRLLTWGQINFEKRFLVVGKSKAAARCGRDDRP